MSIRGFLEKAAHWVGVLWAQFGLLILIVLLLNALAGMVVRNVRRFQRRPHPVREEAYGRAPWTEPYYSALNRVRAMWYPYVYWKSAPLSSPYLNVDRQGNRATWNKPRAAGNGGRQLNVFTFGGSAMWGFGVRDDYTLASLLSKHLAQKTDYNVKVFNYGQLGYVSTQEVLLLYELLREGLRPDIVIFDDGVNDISSAYQAGIAGLAGNESSRVREFNLVGSNRWRRKRLYLTALRAFVFNMNTAEFGRLIGGKDSDGEAESDVEARDVLSYLVTRPEDATPGALERKVLDLYLFNVRLVQMLGMHFGFRPLFFWQPAIYFKNHLTPYERNFIGDPGLEKFLLATYQRMAAIAPANGVRDLSEIFKDNPETCFTDTWHPTESGNELIADAMAGPVTSALAEITRSGAASAGTGASAAPRP